jgi:hypothetical protein
MMNEGLLLHTLLVELIVNNLRVYDMPLLVSHKQRKLADCRIQYYLVTLCAAWIVVRSLWEKIRMILTYSMVQSPSWEANWFAASQEIPHFYGTRRFITALTSVRHLSLSWANPIQSTNPHPTSRKSILILSTHLRLGLPSGLFPSGFPTKTLYAPSPPPYTPHALPISFFSILSPAQYWVRSTDH